MLQASACEASLHIFHVSEQSWLVWNVFLHIFMLFGVFDDGDCFSQRTKGEKEKQRARFMKINRQKDFVKRRFVSRGYEKNRRRTLFVMRCSPVLWICDCYPNLRSALQQVVRQAMQGLVLQERSSLSH